MIITPEEGIDVGIIDWHWDWSSHHEDIISEEENDNNGNHQINIFTVYKSHKRGRYCYKENKHGVHGSDSFDNIERKIQVHFLTFLINFCNDALKAEYEHSKSTFKQINYRDKARIIISYIQQLKYSNIKDILNLEISNKYKNYQRNANKDLLNKVESSDWLDKLFQMNWIELFNYYYNNEKPHQYNHYHIINKMTEPIFTEDWSFGQEIKLLGALAHLGIGNWEEISKIIGKGKFECESHYYSFYYKNSNDYLPNLNNNITLRSKNYINDMRKNKSLENSILKNIANEIGYIPFPFYIDNNQSNRSININRNNTKSEHSNPILLQNAYNTLGYWPKRKEFDVEYKNDAEIELMEIDYKEKEYNKNKENLFSIYDKILNHYNNILDKREERKDFVLDKNLYDVKKQLKKKKKLSKEDREIYQSMKQSLKYLKNEEFKQYFEGIILEKNIKSRLNQLLYYYKMGYKTYGQIYKYIYDLKRKNNKLRNKYMIKSSLKNLNISLRESTVKQVNKFNENIDDNK